MIRSMTDLADCPEPDVGGPVVAVLAAPYALTAFVSAALVFMVEPMVARLVLPLLGGSPAVWNTSLAFFQAALLVGYIYAHLLPRLRRIGAQIGVHLAVLAAAGLTLPLHVANLFGEPSSTAPALWLVGVLAVSIGAPFAALSATAPLVQAWHARAARPDGGREPYGLYAASNLGSLIALVAYPAVIEPNMRLHIQTASWSAGYGGFIVLMAILGVAAWRAARGSDTAAAVVAPAETGGWRERATWLVLAAIPSSLMLGVTTYVTTDLGSAPFLWVAPLALYLATFIIAFHDRQVIRPQLVLALQAGSLALCGVYFWAQAFLPGLALHLTCFFLTALVCHQALVARRPPAERLTDFYIWMSLGGVIGGAFNAFIAPLVFNTVVEYPALLILSCLVRPWGRGAASPWTWAASIGVLASAVIAIQLISPASATSGITERVSHYISPSVLALAALFATAAFAFLLRGRAVLFMVGIFVLMVAAQKVSDRRDELRNWRDFFGVLSLSHEQISGLGEVKMLWHGTTLHGAQSPLPAYQCRPLVYYAPQAPIGQVFEAARLRKAAINIGAVGLGTGSVAAHAPGRRLALLRDRSAGDQGRHRSARLHLYHDLRQGSHRLHPGRRAADPGQTAAGPVRCAVDRRLLLRQRAGASAHRRGGADVSVQIDPGRGLGPAPFERAPRPDAACPGRRPDGRRLWTGAEVQRASVGLGFERGRGDRRPLQCGACAIPRRPAGRRPTPRVLSHGRTTTPTSSAHSFAARPRACERHPETGLMAARSGVGMALAPADMVRPPTQRPDRNMPLTTFWQHQRCGSKHNAASAAQMTDPRQGIMIPVSNTLRLKVGGHLQGIDRVALAKAEAAIKGLTNNVETWMQRELDKLEAARECVRVDGYNSATAECLYVRANDLRGLGAAYGYPIVTEIAGSLCRLIEDPATRLKVPLVLLDAHIGSLKAAVRGGIRDIDDPSATTLLAKLQTLLRDEA
jgi:hypothetical protein